jgi:hypothetical protein
MTTPRIQNPRRIDPRGTNPRITKSSMLHVVVGIIGAAAAGTADAADPSIPTYSAVYQVEYKGKEAGTSEFKVTYDAASDTYEFTSRTLVKGFAKLAFPNPAIERSHFRVVDGRIRPVEFWYEDGSRKGEDNQHLEFDWQRRVVIVTSEGARREVALDDRSLDRGSMQVAMMRDMASTQQLGDYRSAGEDDQQGYKVTDNGEAQMATGIGTLTTRSVTQQRDGSSRSTWLWFAPDLRYLPVRIERRRDGEIQTAFQLESLTGIDKK